MKVAKRLGTFGVIFLKALLEMSYFLSVDSFLYGNIYPVRCFLKSYKRFHFWSYCSKWLKVARYKLWNFDNFRK